MSAYLKFSCVYCGQHIECNATLGGRQFLCPTCQHPIAVPARFVHRSMHIPLLKRDTWETDIVLPCLETRIAARAV